MFFRHPKTINYHYFFHTFLNELICAPMLFYIDYLYIALLLKDRLYLQNVGNLQSVELDLPARMSLANSSDELFKD